MGGNSCQGITMPVSIRGISRVQERSNKQKAKEGKAKSAERDQKGRARVAKERAAKRAPKYSGTGWCETFYTCKKGDGRNFRAWVKAQGYKEYRGACAHSNGRYGRRHKYWHGKYTVAKCKAKCNSMRNCQGITMPMSIKSVVCKFAQNIQHCN